MKGRVVGSQVLRQRTGLVLSACLMGHVPRLGNPQRSSKWGWLGVAGAWAEAGNETSGAHGDDEQRAKLASSPDRETAPKRSSQPSTKEQQSLAALEPSD